jgi:hypothetical protein
MSRLQNHQFFTFLKIKKLPRFMAEGDGGVNNTNWPIVHALIATGLAYFGSGQAASTRPSQSISLQTDKFDI